MYTTPSVKRLRDIYIDVAKLQKDLRRLNLNNTFTRVKIERVLALHRPSPGTRSIDMGCGVGTISILLADTGATIIGIDYNYLALRYAHLSFGLHYPQRTFRAICCDGQLVALKNNVIDSIFAVDFTEHIEDDLLHKVMGEWYRILSSGGLCVIYTPNPQHLFERMRKRNFLLHRNPTHVGLRPMDEYLRMLREVGFNIVKAYFEPTHLPFFSTVERILMRIPSIGSLARRRICILAAKSHQPFSHRV